MGDISAEPSMEEILSSIKRIIAEEGDPPSRPRKAAGTPTPPRASQARAAPPADEPEMGEPEVLELNTPVAPPTRSESPRAEQYRAEPSRAEHSSPAPSQPEPGRADAIVSRETVEASRGALDALSRLVTRPEPGSDGTLEGLVREMLRPVLREWCDAHLPVIVEQMVAREIAKITGPN